MLFIIEKRFNPTCLILNYNLVLVFKLSCLLQLSCLQQAAVACFNYWLLACKVKLVQKKKGVLENFRKFVLKNIWPLKLENYVFIMRH